LACVSLGSGLRGSGGGSSRSCLCMIGLKGARGQSAGLCYIAR
jgi:hypothetical protein